MARKLIYPRCGEVWLVDFDPTVGAEIRKTHPALIIQNDLGNRFSPITIVSAITSAATRTYPFEVPLSAGEAGLAVDSIVTLNQIRSVDRQRLLRRLGMASQQTMRAVDQAILVSLGVELTSLPPR